MNGEMGNHFGFFAARYGAFFHNDVTNEVFEQLGSNPDVALKQFSELCEFGNNILLPDTLYTGPACCPLKFFEPLPLSLQFSAHVFGLAHQSINMGKVDLVESVSEPLELPVILGNLQLKFVGRANWLPSQFCQAFVHVGCQIRHEVIREERCHHLPQHRFIDNAG